MGLPVWSAPSPRPSISKSSQKAADPTAPSRSPIRRRQRRRQSPGVAGHVSSSAPGPSVPGPSGAAVAITASGNTGGTWVVEGLDSAVAQPGLAAQPQQQHRHAASSPYPPPHALRATEGELPPVPDLRMNTAGAHLLPSTLLPPPLNRSRTIRSDVQSAGRQSSRSSRASRRSRTPRLEAQPHPAPHAYWGPSYGAQATTDAMRDHRYIMPRRQNDLVPWAAPASTAPAAPAAPADPLAQQAAPLTQNFAPAAYVHSDADSGPGNRLLPVPQIILQEREQALQQGGGGGGGGGGSGAAQTLQPTLPLPLPGQQTAYRAGRRNDENMRPQSLAELAEYAINRPRDARVAISGILNSQPADGVDGLGDRERSFSPDNWETMLSTIAPDSQLPTRDSSFTSSAAASASFSMTDSQPDSRSRSAASSARTHLTVPSRRSTPSDITHAAAGQQASLARLRGDINSLLHHSEISPGDDEACPDDDACPATDADSDTDTDADTDTGDDDDDDDDNDNEYDDDDVSLHLHLDTDGDSDTDADIETIVERRARALAPSTDAPNAPSDNDNDNDNDSNASHHRSSDRARRRGLVANPHRDSDAELVHWRTLTHEHEHEHEQAHAQAAIELELELGNVFGRVARSSGRSGRGARHAPAGAPADPDLDLPATLGSLAGVGESLERMRPIIDHLARRLDIPDQWWMSVGLTRALGTASARR